MHAFKNLKAIAASFAIPIAITLALVSLPAAAQYPAKPIRMVVPFPPGGATDIVARVVADKLTQALGQSVVVENRPGAGGTIGSDVVAKAPADGYTLLMATTSTHAVAPSLYAKLPYDPLKDFAPIANVASSPLILVVSSSLPVTSVRELIAYAKANPGKLSYASSGNGTVNHLTGEMLKGAIGADLVHVPYKGSALAFPDVMEGRVPLMFDYAISMLPQIKSGKLRPLAVTSLKRTVTMPDTPTLDASGLPGFESILWVGLFAPPGTPREIVARINAEVGKLLQLPDVKEKFAQQGADPVGGSPEQFAAAIRSDIAKWGKIVKDSGAKAD
jgi:tripartite-type tricarboxylate transporter receptor subunit TctC